MDPEVTSGQEAGDQMAAKMVNPSFLLELSHCSVDGWEASHSICPGIKQFLVSSPFNLLTHWVQDHLVEMRRLVGAQIKPFSEEQLAMEGLWWLRVLSSSCSVNILNVPKEGPGANAAELQVGTETCRIWFYGRWVRLRLSK